MNKKLNSAVFTARATHRTNHGGFTMMELLVVIATTGILVVMVLPTLAFSKAKSQAEYCLSNFNQLAKACAMYASDNQEFYPPNPDDGNTVPRYDWCPGNVAGWWSLGAGGSPDAGNATYLTNRTYSSLAPYLASSAVPFKCPADWRVCYYNGKVVPVVRSVSANAGVGTADASWLSGGSHSGRPSSPVNGPWLNGSHSHMANTPYATFGKSTSFKNCSPSEIWIYADEDPFSINDSSIAVVAATPTIIDFPSTRHQNAGCFGFCDGHTEMHRWKSNVFVLQATHAVGLQYQDWYWFASHATRSFITGSVP
jgi:type II secretory pathway pseudopilin PulG